MNKLHKKFAVLSINKDEIANALMNTDIVKIGVNITDAEARLVAKNLYANLNEKEFWTEFDKQFTKAAVSVFKK